MHLTSVFLHSEINALVKDNGVKKFMIFLYNLNSYNPKNSRDILEYWYPSVIKNQMWIQRVDKGQLFSEWIYEDKTSPKKRTKNCKDFCPVSEGRNPCNFSFVFWEKFYLHKFILKLSDL